MPHSVRDAPAERAGQRGAAHKGGDARRALFGPVPEAEVVDHAREDPCLAGTEEEAEGRDAGAVGCSADGSAEGAEA